MNTMLRISKFPHYWTAWRTATWWKRTYFTLFHSVLRISLAVLLVAWCLLVCEKKDGSGEISMQDFCPSFQLQLIEQQTITFHLLLAVLWQVHELQMELLPCTASSAGEPTRHPCSTTGMMQDNQRLTWSDLEHLLGELLCHREEARSEDCIF